MKIVFTLLTGIALLAAGCNSCYDCNMGTQQNPDVREYCKKAYPGDKDMFEKTIKEYETAGYVCTKK